MVCVLQVLPSDKVLCCKIIIGNMQLSKPFVGKSEQKGHFMLAILLLINVLFHVNFCIKYLLSL